MEANAAYHEVRVLTGSQVFEASDASREKAGLEEGHQSAVSL
jgi:hypothetical protein